MISFNEAQSIILKHVKLLPRETKLLAESRNCYLAEDICAPFPVPRFDHSAVDGYAIRAADVASANDETPVTLKVIGTVKTGNVASDHLTPRCAIRIFTGAMLPPGADTVVMVEDVVFTNDSIHISAPIKTNKNIRRTGEEFAKDSICLPKSTKLTPAAIGLTATLGIQHVHVHRKPRVALLITGSELVAPGTPLGDAQIYDSNRFALTAALSDLGIEHVLTYASKDDQQTLQNCIVQALHEADVVITSGGASVGDVDYVKPALQAIGATIQFDKVAIKPGKPTVFATLEDKLILGLPGNPVSALVTYLLFVKPALQKMMGCTVESNIGHFATLEGNLTKRTPRTEFVRAKSSLKDEVSLVTPCIGQESHMLGGLVTADSLIIFDGEPRPLTNRSQVQVLPILWS